MKMKTALCLILLGATFLTNSMAFSQAELKTMQTKVNSELTAQTNNFNHLNTTLKSKEAVFQQKCQDNPRQCSAIKGQIDQIDYELKPLQLTYDKTCTTSGTTIELECNSLSNKIKMLQAQAIAAKTHFTTLNCHQSIDKQYCEDLQSDISQIKGQIAATQNNIKGLESQVQAFKAN